MANLDAVFKLTGDLPYPSLTDAERAEMKVDDEKELVLPGTQVCVCLPVSLNCLPVSTVCPQLVFALNCSPCTNPQLVLPGTQIKFPDVAFFFADICAGPGGFTEYLLWRAQRREQLKYSDRFAVGWGFTLRVGDGIDFDLDKFNRDIYQDTFHPEYGKDGTGDIFNEENVRQLEARVNDGTLSKGM